MVTPLTTRLFRTRKAVHKEEPVKRRTEPAVPDVLALTAPDDSSRARTPHDMEQAVRRQLLAHPSLRISSLVIRRINNGVCLEGVLETDNDDAPDICRLAQAVTGVDQVLNHLVVRRTAKG